MASPTPEPMIEIAAKARAAIDVLRAVADDNDNRDQGTCGCGCDCSKWMRSLAADLDLAFPAAAALPEGDETP